MFQSVLQEPPSKQPHQAAPVEPIPESGLDPTAPDLDSVSAVLKIIDQISGKERSKSCCCRIKDQRAVPEESRPSTGDPWSNQTWWTWATRMAINVTGDEATINGISNPGLGNDRIGAATNHSTWQGHVEQWDGEHDKLQGYEYNCLFAAKSPDALITDTLLTVLRLWMRKEDFSYCEHDDRIEQFLNYINDPDTP